MFRSWQIEDLKTLFDFFQRLGSFMEMLYGGRYVLLLMSLFSMYCGLIYNEFFSVPFHIFGASAYKCQDISCRCLLFVSLQLIVFVPIGFFSSIILASQSITCLYFNVTFFILFNLSYNKYNEDYLYPFTTITLTSTAMTTTTTTSMTSTTTVT